MGRAASATQGAAQRGQLQVVRPQKVPKLAAAGLGELVRDVVADCVRLHSTRTHAAGLRQAAP